MSDTYFSFPQRPPDEAVPTISKLYNTVHKRLASIVSAAPNSTPDGAAQKLGDTSDHITEQHIAHSESVQQAYQVSQNTIETPSIETIRHHSRQTTSEGKVLLQSALPFQAPLKAAPSVQSEALTVLGDTDYADSNASPAKSQITEPEIVNVVPGFALQREVSSDSEPPESPKHKRRPSLLREESISTVLSRLKSGRLSKEFWMQDKNAHACFRCEATFNSKQMKV